MLLLITILIVALVASVFVAVAPFNDYIDGFYSFILFGFTGGILGIFISLGVTDAFVDEHETVSKDKYSLTALSVGSNTEGSFFLGSGYIDEELAYSYAQIDDNGGVRLMSTAHESFDYNDIVVYEDTDNPYVVKTKTRTGSHPWSFIQVYDNTIEFHVPKGSVVQQFSVDVGDV